MHAQILFLNPSSGPSRQGHVGKHCSARIGWEHKDSHARRDVAVHWKGRLLLPYLSSPSPPHAAGCAQLPLQGRQARLTRPSLQVFPSSDPSGPCFCLHNIFSLQTALWVLFEDGMEELRCFGTPENLLASAPRFSFLSLALPQNKGKPGLCC